MRRAAWSLALVVVLALPAAAAPAVSKTVNAPADRVWAVTEAVLKQLGWDIDKADRTIGWITTDSRRVDGEDYGVYAKGTRHRLRIEIRPAGEGRSTLTVERTVFRRERILFVDKDEPVTVSDQTVERDVLAAIERAL